MSLWLMPPAVVGAMIIAAIVTDTQSASAFSTAIHERITRNAYPFMTYHVSKARVRGAVRKES